MALQIWIPFIGDNSCSNQGIAGDLAVVTQPTLINGGKIGTKAISSGQYKMSASQTAAVLNDNAWSLAFWIYINADDGTSLSTKLFGGEDPRQYTTFLYPTVNDLHTSWYNDTNYAGGTILYDVLPSYTWTHVAITFKQTDHFLTVYINGSAIKTFGLNSFNGSDYNKETTLFDNTSVRYFNDYRVYDHCLSPKEVKEISKALVLHYPLNDAYITESTTVYDCSGYSNNGTVIGSLSCVDDSPRYNVSTYFSANTNQIVLPSINYSGFGNSYTFSWWAKGNPQMMWGFGDGNRLNIPYAGYYANTGDGSNNPFYTPGTTTTITSPLSTTEFKHYVAVGDGSTLKLYVNGIHYGTAKTYKALTGTQIYINGWNSSGDYGGIEYVSDFRIYATALSADDIKELYSTSCIITNQ